MFQNLRNFVEKKLYDILSIVHAVVLSTNGVLKCLSKTFKFNDLVIFTQKL